jgi:putative membrane protein
MREVFDSFAHIDDFLVYLGVSVVYLGAFVMIYVRITPYPEFKLIAEGNMAASFSVCGSILGFVVPLSAAIQHSVSLLDMLIWGAVAMIVQIVAFFVSKMVIPTMSKDITANKTSVGFFLGSFSLAIGLLNAACMSY